MRDPISLPHGTNLSDGASLTRTAQRKNSVLGTLCFSADAGECPMQTMHADREIPCLRVPMKRLDAGESVCDVWHGNGPWTQGRYGAIHYRHDDDVLFGAMTLSETLFEGGADQTPLQQATESAYRQVFALLDMLHFPHLFRFWNYLADINGHSFGLERYRQFNLGRQNAFLAEKRDGVRNIPAACALGTAQGPLTITFLAGRAAPLSIENPRQVSAYQYPQQYGPRSPMFSRATLVHWGQDEVLFVSGTASIVGHATLHPANVVAQTRETMTNIEAVLTEANRLASHTKFDLSSLVYKVYVRHSADLEQIRVELTRCVGDALKAVYLQADVCRQDLLLEIEATAARPSVFVSGWRD